VLFTTRPQLTGGTQLTAEIAASLGKPTLHLCAANRGPLEAAVELKQFIADHAVARLNVAGPRASQDPGVAAYVNEVLTAAIAAVKTD
jgi:hypothetical protein